MVSRRKAHAGHRSKKCARPSRKGLGDDERDDAELQRLSTGGWQEAGNYNSNLSKLIWMAQLLIFESVYHYHVNNGEDGITVHEPAQEAVREVFAPGAGHSFRSLAYWAGGFI
ncbi:hypothetical protein E4U13_007342 [Claviceps humidiphila]|uniref:Uncharacterized protein n=1 Tax=Claviceps humidiphila TaxID=1294629 RepID=A0A9P7TU37_9HYPO|nr:hypothetical protein E4U13_007342 [Claviceps humidiphila]